MKRKDPLVSVIVPVFNRSRVTGDAVASVLFQTFTDLEIILVDDGSTAAMDSMTSRFSQDPRFRYLRIEHSGKPGFVRNKGVGFARGSYIAFLDSDDIWLPQKLEHQVDALGRANNGRSAEQHIPLIHTREFWLRGEKIVSQKKQRYARRGRIFRDALEKCIIGPSTTLMEKQVFKELGGFRDDLEIAEDYEFWLRLTSRYPVEYIEEPLIVKRAGHGPQLSQKYDQIEIFRLDALRSLVEERWFARNAAPGTDRTTVEMQELAEGEYARKCRIYAEGCRKRGRSKDATEYEEEARYYGAAGEA
jgi:glycosyltransferase involved in cell wall biosynthesis